MIAEILLTGAGLVVLLYGAVILLSHQPRTPLPTEKTYITPVSSAPRALPDVQIDKAEVAISVVIPCYNEAKRLENMLQECVIVLNAQFGAENWEILLVDDGSSDGTCEYAIQWALDHSKNCESQNQRAGTVGLANPQLKDRTTNNTAINGASNNENIPAVNGTSGVMKLNPSQFRITQLQHNRGKGGAVVHGMCHARGELIMFADADGASKFGDVVKLADAVNSDPAKAVAAIGSRAHLVNTDAVVKRSFIRNLLMYGLHTLLYVFGIRTIRDTQCGFKLFSRKAAASIFPFMHTEGWIFDVEVLILAEKKGIPVHEIPISWHEVPGSKIELAKDSIKMAIDLVVMRFAYLLGVYNAHTVTVDRSVAA